jgi:hypothetical protein
MSKPRVHEVWRNVKVGGRVAPLHEIVKNHAGGDDLRNSPELENIHTLQQDTVAALQMSEGALNRHTGVGVEVVEVELVRAEHSAVLEGRHNPVLQWVR